MRISADYLIVGSGVAGLYFALKAAEVGSVVLLTKSETRESNTAYAQGGIASVTDPADSTEIHRRDTLEAGAGICDEAAVEATVREGPGVIEELVQIGTRFSRTEDGGLSLGREGGHSRSRIVHAEDLTGGEISRALVDAVGTKPSIRVLEHHLAVDLIVGGGGTCHGVYAVDMSQGDLVEFAAPVTVLASGGAGQIYASTTNPQVATGDGIAMAYRAGASVGNLEFFQFHPTMLYDPERESFLITEAMRGHGAVLVNHEGEHFVEGRHAGGSMGTRDVVSRAIVEELKQSGRKCVFLDITGRDAEQTRRRFPNINRHCLAVGIDMTAQPIPVIPAAHYLCGGVRADLNGRSDLPGLYAIGEVSLTGLHGANRLASNSLLEALVFSKRAAAHAAASRRQQTPESLPAWSPSSRAETQQGTDETASLEAQHRQAVQLRMWEDVGIVRSDASLRRACADLKGREDDIEQLCRDRGWTPRLLELRNVATVAHLVARSARMRQESRGGHYNQDHPDRDDAHWQRSSLLRVSPQEAGDEDPSGPHSSDEI